MARVKVSEKLNLADALEDVLGDLYTEVKKQSNAGLEKASDYLVERYKAATPTNTGKTRDSWTVEKKYNGVKYVFNTNLTPKRIPVANLIEFARGGKPFMRRTFEAETGNIIKIIEEELRNGSTK